MRRWEDWHDCAVQLVETLARSTQLLERAAKAYDEQEGAAVRAVRSVPADIDL